MTKIVVKTRESRDPYSAVTDADQETEADLDTIMIDLDDIPLDDILTHPNTALAQAIARIIPSRDDDVQRTNAGFSNFI